MLWVLSVHLQTSSEFLNDHYVDGHVSYDVSQVGPCYVRKAFFISFLSAIRIENTFGCEATSGESFLVLHCSEFFGRTLYEIRHFDLL